MKKIRKLLISNPIASPPWTDLPSDVTANILHRLGSEEILKSAQKVCATWWRVCHEDPSMWRVIDMIDPPDEKDLSEKSAATMCCHAVNRSQGGLIDIRIGPFYTDKLLRYIADRSSRLKRLTVAAKDISGVDLKGAVRKWGELEELRLDFSPFITAQVIEAVGKCCPLLNTFSFNNNNSGRQQNWYINDDRALAIAKNMPNLSHLQLYMFVFSKKGLQAILDGCQCLESLDLRRSTIYGLEEEGDLQKRCSGIKDLRLPSKSNWISLYSKYNRISL